MAERTYYAYLTPEEASDPKAAAEHLERIFDGHAHRDGYRRLGSIAWHVDDRIRVEGQVLHAVSAESDRLAKPASRAS